MNGPDLASIGGIVAATIICVEILKRTLAHWPVFQRIWTWVYAVLVAALLTVLARYVFGTLTGDIWGLLLQAICNAATASGFYEWWNNRGNQLGDTVAALNARGEADAEEWNARHGLSNLLLLCLLPTALCLPLVGCAVPQTYVAADRATYQAIAPEYSVYVAADPSLSPEQRERRQRTVDTWRLRVEQVEAATTQAAR